MTERYPRRTWLRKAALALGVAFLMPRTPGRAGPGRPRLRLRALRRREIRGPHPWAG